MPETDAQQGQYRCPGATYTISRSVHLARLAAFHPACRQCPHRHEWKQLSARRQRHWLQIHGRAGDCSTSEGSDRDRDGAPVHAHADSQGLRTGWPMADHLTIQPEDAADARRWAAAFGLGLRRGLFGPIEHRQPVVVLATDGRPSAAEPVARANEALRWSDCNVIDLGSATADCLGFAINHLGTDAGLMLAGPNGDRRPLAARFWGPDGMLLSRGAGLERLAAQYDRGINRPTRRLGQTRRFDATAPYLAGWRPSYHGLRPLRIALDCASPPLRRYLDDLLAESACQVFDGPLETADAPRRLAQCKAHLGMALDRFGELITVYDERGGIIDPARLAAALQHPLPTSSPPDGLGVFTALLQLLSQGDRPLSLVVDRRRRCG